MEHAQNWSSRSDIKYYYVSTIMLDWESAAQSVRNSPFHT